MENGLMSLGLSALHVLYIRKETHILASLKCFLDVISAKIQYITILFHLEIVDFI